MIFLDEIVGMADGRGHEQRKDESDDVVLATPDVDVDAIKGTEEGETPANGVDDDFLATVVELVDDRSKQQEVDQRPDAERVWSRGKVSFLARVVDALWTRNGVDITTKEEEVDDDINELEEDIVFPVAPVRHCYRR